MCGSHHRLGVDVELLVDVGDLAGGVKAVHADEAAFADVAFPAEFKIPTDLTFQLAFVEMYQDIDPPSVTAPSKQCLKLSDIGRATDPVVRRPS
jgi:hypothetical protein